MTASPMGDNLPASQTPGPDHRASAPRPGLLRRLWDAARYLASAEPALLRALVVAVIAALVATGVVVPDGAESSATDILGGVWALAALVQGFSTRAKVTPVAGLDSGGPGDA